MSRKIRVQGTEKNRSRSRSRQKRERSKSEERAEDESGSDTEEMEMVAGDIRNAFIEFHTKLGHDKGLVFTLQDRQKMIKQQARLKKQNRHGRFINWSRQSQWEPADQIANIKDIFERRKPKLANEEQIAQAKEIFQKVSYIFCSQVTKELYQLLMLLLQNSLKPHHQLTAGLMEQVYADNSRFVFFGYQFSKYFQLPQDRNLVKNAYQELGTLITTIFQRQFSNND